MHGNIHFAWNRNTYAICTKYDTENMNVKAHERH